MRQAPGISNIPSYPVVAGTCLLAVVVSVAWWAGLDISPLVMNAMLRRWELWRLFTCIFPHVGVLHLAFNVYWIWVFGTAVEEVYGRVKTAGLMLMFAVGPAALEYAFADGGVGLSGVGYGFFGLLWILSLHEEKFRDTVDRGTVYTFIGWFFFCILTTVTHFMNVANIEHGAGAILGIATGFAIAQPERRMIHVTGIAGILAFGIWGSTVGRPYLNLSSDAGREEAALGYRALIAHRDKEGVQWYRDAVAYRSKEGSYWYNLGIAYGQMGNTSAMLDAYRNAADLGEARAQYVLGSIYEQGMEGVPKDSAQAASWYARAVVHDDLYVTNNVAWSYVTSSDPLIRNPASGLTYARKMIEMEKGHPDPTHLDTLAEAFYANGLYADAVKTEEQAIGIAPSDKQAGFQKSLERYQLALKSGTGKNQ